MNDHEIIEAWAASLIARDKPPGAHPHLITTLLDVKEHIKASVDEIKLAMPAKNQTIIDDDVLTDRVVSAIAHLPESQYEAFKEELGDIAYTILATELTSKNNKLGTDDVSRAASKVKYALKRLDYITSLDSPFSFVHKAKIASCYLLKWVCDGFKYEPPGLWWIKELTEDLELMGQTASARRLDYYSDILERLERKYPKRYLAGHKYNEQRRDMLGGGCINLTQYIRKLVNDENIVMVKTDQGTKFKADSADPPKKTEPKPDPGKDSPSKEALALAILKDHPDWTNERIAEAVGVHVKTLSSKKWHDFREARKILKGHGKAATIRGYKDPETGDIDAWDDDDLA